MMVDSSQGGQGHKSYLWFDVKTDGYNYYQFWYYSKGAGTAKLATTFEHSDTVVAVDMRTKDRWSKTQCFPLPSTFAGKIYIIAEHGGSYNEDAAIDSVQLSSSCKGRSDKSYKHFVEEKEQYKKHTMDRY